MDESFIHLLNRHLLTVYYIAGKIPDAADTAGTQAKTPAIPELKSELGKIGN